MGRERDGRSPRMRNAQCRYWEVRKRGLFFDSVELFEIGGLKIRDDGLALAVDVGSDREWIVERLEITDKVGRSGHDAGAVQGEGAKGLHNLGAVGKDEVVNEVAGKVPCNSRHRKIPSRAQSQCRCAEIKTGDFRRWCQWRSGRCRWVRRGPWSANVHTQDGWGRRGDRSGCRGRPPFRSRHRARRHRRKRFL